MTSVRRIQKDLKELKESPLDSITAGPIDESNIFEWQGTIVGPSDTPYAGGLFYLAIHFPMDYPFKCPKIRFNTRIFHPNINDSGQICLDILKDGTNGTWSPALSISRVLLSISSLLADPNPNDPLNIEAANIYKSDINAFNEKAKMMTRKFAC